MSTAAIERPEEQTQQRSASQIVREWPEEKTCFGAYRLPDGSMCSLGVLADAKGYDWDAWAAPPNPNRPLRIGPGRYAQQEWGFTESEVVAICEAHDLYGKETAADLIESFEVKHAAR